MIPALTDFTVWAHTLGDPDAQVCMVLGAQLAFVIYLADTGRDATAADALAAWNQLATQWLGTSPPWAEVTVPG